jgi:hypothetical protein
MNQKRIIRRLERASTPPRFTHALLVALFPKTMGYAGFLAQEKLSNAIGDKHYPTIKRIEGENK